MVLRQRTCCRLLTTTQLFVAPKHRLQAYSPRALSAVRPALDVGDPTRLPNQASARRSLDAPTSIHGLHILVRPQKDYMQVFDIEKYDI
jgi:hypothetical protein